MPKYVLFVCRNLLILIESKNNNKTIKVIVNDNKINDIIK